MKITDIEAYPVWIGTRNQLLVKVQTDEGICGWGESGVVGRELAVAAAVKHYAAFLIGRNPMNIGALWQEMYRSQYFEGGRILTGAISAIDIALYDLVGKSLNVPAYQLLGGRQRDFVPAFATTSHPSSAEDLIADVKLLVENNWDVIRILPANFEDEKILNHVNRFRSRPRGSRNCAKPSVPSRSSAWSTTTG
jgi:galactonate dehydratase